MNQDEWEENKLQEAEEQVISRTSSRTPTPQKRPKKRIREEDYSPLTLIEAKQFLIYTKNPKNNPAPVFKQDEEG